MRQPNGISNGAGSERRRCRQVGNDSSRLGQHTALFLFLLSGAKILATGLTLAGGGVGGVFMPALVVGGTFGGAAGVGLEALLPSLGIEPVASGISGSAG